MTRSLALLACLALAAEAPAQKAKETPGEAAYRALVKEHNVGLAAFQKSLEAARTPAEQQKVFRDKHPKIEDFAPRFFALASKHADSPAAVDALTWVALHPAPPDSKVAGLRPKALKALLADHPKDARLGLLCTALVPTIDADSEAFLRGVLDKAPAAGAKARACASLAHNLKYRARLVLQLKEEKDALKRWEEAWGKAAVAYLFKRSSDELSKESIKLFERLEKDHADVKHPTHGDLGQFAKAHLLSLRQPVEEGKAAPQVSGFDMAFKAMKLSDFKGQVVLLVFQSHALPACRASYPEQRALLARMKGKPFVLLGVSGDPDRAAARKALAAEKLTYRSWFDGGGTDGPLAARWEIDIWPTLVLIDAKGVVREMLFGWPPRKELDAAIGKLLKGAATK